MHQGDRLYDQDCLWYRMNHRRNNQQLGTRQLGQSSRSLFPVNSVRFRRTRINRWTDFHSISKHLRKVTFAYKGIYLRRITRKKLGLETRADNELSGRRKSGWVTDMIPVPVTSREQKMSVPCSIWLLIIINRGILYWPPDDSGNFISRDAISVENVDHLFLDVDFPSLPFEMFTDGRWKRLQIFRNSKIVKDLLTRRVLDQEWPSGKGGHIFHPLHWGFHEKPQL